MTKSSTITLDVLKLKIPSQYSSCSSSTITLDVLKLQKGKKADTIDAAQP